MVEKDTNAQDKLFNLQPIGRLKLQKQGGLAFVMEKYRPALEHLKLFSHALIFFLNQDANNQAAGVSKNVVELRVVKLVDMDETKGLLRLDENSLEIDTVLLDIKPYFPCEDRVKIVQTPRFMKNLPVWWEGKADKINEFYREGDINSKIDFDEEDDLKAYQTGRIRKIEGEAWLEFEDTFKERETQAFEELKGFSHIRIIWWFDRFDKSRFRSVLQVDPPYENAPKMGIFASRSPVRPNPIAVTTVKILGIDTFNRRIKVSELDALDRSPIIAIRPYVPCIDRVEKVIVPKWLSHWPEWLSEKESELKGESLKLSLNHLESRPIKSLGVQYTLSDEEIESLFENNEFKNADRGNEIIIRGARQNNLKNLNLAIPKNKITVITGVSGSGKSSLAFDTLYAESQRRFMDSLSLSSGMVISQMEKPDVDQITGLPPAVAVAQKTAGRNPRSTVGTMTDIYDYLKLLFSKIGTRYCPECQKPIRSLSTKEIEDLICRLREGTVFTLNAFDNKETIAKLKVPDEESSLDEKYKAKNGENHQVKVKSEERKSFEKAVREAVRKALEQGRGAMLLSINDEEQFTLQTTQMCYHCQKVLFELTPSVFSFNNPESMCPVCKGLGVKLEIDTDLIVENPQKSLLDEASKWWGNLRKHREKPNANWMKGEVLALAEEMKVDLELPWNKLPEDFKKQVLFGSNGREVRLSYQSSNGRSGEIVRPVEGAYHAISRIFRESSGMAGSKVAEAFMCERECPECQGERLGAEGRLVTIAGTRFPETVKMTIQQLLGWVLNLPKHLTKEELQISVPVLKELKRRLENIMDVGLSYLSLDRASPTLSGGEAQRLRLAAQLGSGLSNILYILDEPSIGLHPKDHQHLIKTIKRIKEEGNTVVVVEHEKDIMLQADYIIDIGPGAGTYGGSLVAEGTPDMIMQNTASLTGKYLRSSRALSGSKARADNFLSIWGASHHNLKKIDVSFPIGLLTCVTGVSGSGKSSLIGQTLYPALSKALNQEEGQPGAYEKIEGFEHIDKVINISQLPIGRTPRSNPATYTGVFDYIRDLYAKAPEAVKRGYKSNKFSFNSKEGQCETCSGEGRRCIPMHFMPDVWTKCPSCHGRCFKSETLEIQYKGLSIADVLNMTIEKACSFFEDQPKIIKILQMMQDVGLGYLKLGQSALTLSGGEAQRIKLAKELSKPDTGKTLYILDEPTTGLHFLDIENLLDILKHITKLGNTVIVIEHNLEVIKNADWIVDLGPEGGEGGGFVIVQGTPKEAVRCKKSYTGAFLADMGLLSYCQGPKQT